VNLFIDTNILLDFYHFTSDELDELSKLLVLMEEKKVTLLLPQQVQHEFRRNREAKIADGLQKLREQHLKLQFPQVCKDYPEYAQLRALQQGYEKEHATLLDKIETDVASKNLKADKVISRLFDLARDLPTGADTLQQARDRVAQGNPPGKPGSLGDALNWVVVLTSMKKGEDLYFVTGDKDYYSPLKKNNFREFLLEEWQGEKESELHVYRHLSEFLMEHYPDIKLTVELRKEIAIEDLSRSGSFEETHEVIAKLSREVEFSGTQLNQVVGAVVSNSQVSSILSDSDVIAFVKDVLKGRLNEVDESLTAQLCQLFKIHRIPWPYDDRTALE
jgi:predicted nucleic acid-binding protein